MFWIMMSTVRSASQFILASCLVVLLAQSAVGKPQLNKMLIYSSIEINEAPNTIQLRDDNGKFLCAGALISPQFVVTAASCFRGIDYKKTVIAAGAKTVTEDGVQLQIDKVTTHPEYDMETNNLDVAVLKLKEPLDSYTPGEDNIQIIPLCAAAVKENDFVHVVGWRHMSKLHADTDNLYWTRIKVVSQEKCNKDYNATPDDGLFCAAGNAYDEQFSVSDLGGPVMYRGTVCGIASSCSNCSDINYTNSFIDLYYFRDFIKGAMV